MVTNGIPLAERHRCLFRANTPHSDPKSANTIPRKNAYLWDLNFNLMIADHATINGFDFRRYPTHHRDAWAAHDGVSKIKSESSIVLRYPILCFTPTL